jgi:hypothetical protein
MDEKTIKALKWLTTELANLQSHFGMSTGENEGKSRDEFFEANYEAMQKHLHKILLDK